MQEKMDFEAIVVEKLKSVGESHLEENESAAEAVGIERLNYEAKEKGKLVFDVVCCEKAEMMRWLLKKKRMLRPSWLLLKKPHRLTRWRRRKKWRLICRKSWIFGPL